MRLRHASLEALSGKPGSGGCRQCKNNNARWGRRSSGRHIGDWQLGGGVLPTLSDDAGRRSASFRIPVDLRFRSIGSFGIMPRVRPVRLAPRSPYDTRRLDLWAGSLPIRCLHHSGDSRFCAVQYVYGCHAQFAGLPRWVVYPVLLNLPPMSFHSVDVARTAPPAIFPGDCEFPATLYRFC